jgi:hypothetical protein
MQIIHSAIFDFVQAQASVDYSITGIAVTFEFPSLPEDPDPDRQILLVVSSLTAFSAEE